MVRYNEAKEVFRDIVDLKLYVPLSAIERTKKDLISAILALEVTKMLKKDIVFDDEAKEFRQKFKINLQYLQKIKNALEKLEINGISINFEVSFTSIPEEEDNIFIAIEKLNH